MAGANHAPIEAQRVEKPGREQGVPILASFTLANLEAHALG